MNTEIVKNDLSSTFKTVNENMQARNIAGDEE